MKFALGILLTIVAAFIGSAIGLAAALIVSFIVLLVFGDRNGAFWDLVFHFIFWGFVVFGGLTGITLGWYGLLRRPRTLAQADDPKLCLACGYDLSWNDSGRCPECAKGIDRDQHRFLARIKKDA